MNIGKSVNENILQKLSLFTKKKTSIWGELRKKLDLTIDCHNLVSTKTWGIVVITSSRISFNISNYVKLILC